MASVKRVTGADGLLGPWDIYANNITINGNISVLGNLASFNASITNIGNAYILLNDLEVGAGVTNGNSGIVIDRGTLPNAYWVYNETSSTFLGNVSGLLNQIQTATPVNANDAVNLGFLSNSASQAAIGLSTYIQFNNSGVLGANINLTFASSNLNVYGTRFGNGNITTSGINQDLKFYGNGTTGFVAIQKGLKFNFKNIAPVSVSSSTLLFGNTVGSGNTGLYVVNSNTGDELIGKNRAIGFNLMI